MTVKAAKPKAPAPAASPSSPSVRLTALVVAVIKSNAHTIQPMRPRSQPGLSKRVNDSVVGTFVYWVTRKANPTPTINRPSIFARLLRPRLRAATTLIQSSTNPTAPPPMIASITKMPVRV